MPDFIVSATRSDDRRTVEYIVAQSAQGALAKAHERGYQDITLHTDDLSAATQQTGKQRETIRKHVSARLMKRLHTSGPVRTRLLMIWEIYRRGAMLSAIILACFLYRRAVSKPWTWLDTLSVLYFIVPPLLTFLMRGARDFRRMQHAQLEARWEDMLALAKRVGPQLSKAGLDGASIGAQWEAKVLAAMGRREEALERMTLARGSAGVPDAMYFIRLASVFDILKDLEAMRQCYEEAARADPLQPAGWLGLAELWAVQLQQPAQARSALQQMAELALGDHTRRALEIVEGAIALGERRFAEARAILESFHRDTARKLKSTPLALGTMRITEALLGVACAGTDDRSGARAWFATALPFLRLHGAEGLLQRWQVVVPEVAEYL